MKSLFVALTLVTVCLSSAQITLDRTDTSSPYISGGPGDTVFGSSTASLSTDGYTLTASMTGQATALLDRTAGRRDMSAASWFYFTVGDEPVEISNFRFEFDTRFVTSGGSRSNPSRATPFVRTLLAEDIGYGVDMLYDFGPEVTGNGRVDYSKMLSTESVYILRPRTSYYIYTDIWYGYMTVDDQGSDPSIGLTMEYGGAFKGLHTSFDYQAVPEPTSIAAIGFGLVGMLARRRKKA